MDKEEQANCPEVTPLNTIDRVLPALPCCQSSIKNTLIQRGVVPLMGTIQEGQAVAGRIALFLDNWRIITRDDWVLSTVQDYKLELLDTPARSP